MHQQHVKVGATAGPISPHLRRDHQRPAAAADPLLRHDTPMSRSQWATDKTRTVRLQVPARGHAQLHDKACDMKYSKPRVLNSSQPAKTKVRRQAARETKLFVRGFLEAGVPI